MLPTSSSAVLITGIHGKSRSSMHFFRTIASFTSYGIRASTVPLDREVSTNIGEIDGYSQPADYPFISQFQLSRQYFSFCYRQKSITLLPSVVIMQRWT
jgi:hypothetical protein